MITFTTQSILSTPYSLFPFPPLSSPVLSYSHFPQQTLCSLKAGTCLYLVSPKVDPETRSSEADRECLPAEGEGKRFKEGKVANKGLSQLPLWAPGA